MHASICKLAGPTCARCIRNKEKASSEQAEIALKPIKYRFFVTFNEIMVEKKRESPMALNFAVLCEFIEVSFCEMKKIVYNLKLLMKI